MIYIIALVLSVAVCAQFVASGIISGNITHLRNGREPEAGVSLIPMVPLFQVLALGLAWALERVMQDKAVLALFGLYAGLLVIWLASYIRAKAEFDRVLSMRSPDEIQ